VHSHVVQQTGGRDLDARSRSPERIFWSQRANEEMGLTFIGAAREGVAIFISVSLSGADRDGKAKRAANSKENQNGHI
jgi:hypothetical protein